MVDEGEQVFCVKLGTPGFHTDPSRWSRVVKEADDCVQEIAAVYNGDATESARSKTVQRKPGQSRSIHFGLSNPPGGSVGDIH